MRKPKWDTSDYILDSKYILIKPKGSSQQKVFFLFLFVPSLCVAKKKDFSELVVKVWFVFEMYFLSIECSPNSCVS